jgi:endoglucanase
MQDPALIVADRRRIGLGRARRRLAGFAAWGLAALLLTPCPKALAQPTSGAEAACEAAAKSEVDPARVRRLARGFSLPGWTNETPPRPPSEAMLAELRQRGLTHVRLPIALEMLAPRFSPPGAIERAFAEIDRALDTLLRLGFAVSLDMHPGERFEALHKSDPEAGLRLLIETWRRVAARYANRPADSVFFEALNEPAVPVATWNAQGPRVVTAIREIAPSHTIVYGPAHFQRYESLAELTPLADRNIVYAFHFYDPMAFTHQGQTWSSDPLAFVQDIPFPAALGDVEPELRRLTREGRAASAAEVLIQFRQPWTAARIEDAFGRVAAWMGRHRRPALVNEFGALSFKAPPGSRANWIRAVRAAAERFCIGWTHWEYADAFGFVHRENGKETLDPVVGPILTQPLR